MSANPELQSVLNRAAPDKFLLVLDLPKGLKKMGIENPLFNITPLQMSVFGTVVPPISIPAVQLAYAGQHLNVSGHARPAYPPLTVNFIIDNMFHNYWILWQWLELLNSARDSIYTGTQVDEYSLLEYQTDMTIYGLNEYNKKSIEFNYTSCFITDLGGIEYNYQSPPTVINSSVTFYFSQLYMKLIPSDISSI
jgi:hypothetical protein